MCERVWRKSALERERRGERERTKERRKGRERRRKRERERECFLFLIHIFFFSAQGTLHFISVFGRTVMTWQHTSLPLLSLTVFLILSLFLQLAHSLPRTLSFPLSSLSLPAFSLSLSLLSITFLFSRSLSSLSSLFYFGPLSQYTQRPSIKKSLTF